MSDTANTRAGRLCRCGHPRDAHEHYRRGADCGICGAGNCPRYRRAHWWQRLTRRRTP